MKNEIEIEKRIKSIRNSCEFKQQRVLDILDVEVKRLRSCLDSGMEYIKRGKEEGGGAQNLRIAISHLYSAVASAAMAMDTLHADISEVAGLEKVLAALKAITEE